MKTEVEDIEMLERAILAEAQDEADQIIAQAKERRMPSEGAHRNRQRRSAKLFLSAPERMRSVYAARRLQQPN